MPLLTICLLSFAVIILAVLLSYTPWAQQHARWLTSLVFYCAIGLIFGALLAKVCFKLGESLAKQMQL